MIAWAVGPSTGLNSPTPTVTDAPGSRTLRGFAPGIVRRPARTDSGAFGVISVSMAVMSTGVVLPPNDNFSFHPNAVGYDACWRLIEMHLS